MGPPVPVLHPWPSLHSLPPGHPLRRHCCVFGEDAVRAAYPELVDLKCRFAQLPRIAEYLARRPAAPL